MRLILCRTSHIRGNSYCPKMVWWLVMLFLFSSLKSTILKNNHAIHSQTDFISCILWNRNSSIVHQDANCPSRRRPYVLPTFTMLSNEQHRALTIVERCASALSILGVATIIGTFSFSRHFRNPTQRIIFINAFYNLFDFIATMISLSGPDAGNDSALCQFQAFCLQMCVRILAYTLR